MMGKVQVRELGPRAQELIAALKGKREDGIGNGSEAGVSLVDIIALTFRLVQSQHTHTPFTEV